MKRKAFVIVAAALFLVGLIIGVSALGLIREIKAQIRPDFSVVIDGEVKTFKTADGETVYPILYDGTTYLPIRAIGEIMGKTVYWYEDDKCVELKEEKTTVTDADVIVTAKNETTPPVTAAPEKPAQKQTDATAVITKEQAEEIVLKKAGLTAAEVVFDRTELDRDDGILHYEIEFKQGIIEYDADISAIDGSIIKWEVDKD